MVYHGFQLRVKMLTSAKNGKQNGDTRTRKPEPGYLNLSTDPTADPPWDIKTRDAWTPRSETIWRSRAVVCNFVQKI